MSKKFQLPTQKGASTSFPDTTKPPTVLRVHGAEPQSALAREIVRKFDAQISHFHRSQLQNYSLSEARVYRTHRTYPGVKMTYTNIHGQETINIYVKGEALKKIEKEVSDYWDWALLELSFPDVEDGGAAFSAFMIVPRIGELLGPATTVPQQGIAEYGMIFGFDAPLQPVIAFPDQGTAPLGSEASTTITASVRVDLRPFRGLPSVLFDVYGYFDPINDSAEVVVGHVLLAIKGRPNHDEAGHVVGSFSPSTYAQALLLYPELAGYTSIIDPFITVGAGFVNYSWSDSLGGFWSPEEPNYDGFGSTGNPGGEFFDGDLTYFPSTSIVATSTRSNVKWYSTINISERDLPLTTPPADGETGYTVIWVDSTGYYGPLTTIVPLPTEYPLRPGTVSGVITKGIPPDANAFLGDFKRWETTSIYPRRWALGDLGEVTATSIEEPEDGSPGNHFGMPKLGTCTLDLKHGGISWKAEPI